MSPSDMYHRTSCKVRLRPFMFQSISCNLWQDFCSLTFAFKAAHPLRQHKLWVRGHRIPMYQETTTQLLGHLEGTPTGCEQPGGNSGEDPKLTEQIYVSNLVWVCSMISQVELWEAGEENSVWVSLLKLWITAVIGKGGWVDVT